MPAFLKSRFTLFALLPVIMFGCGQGGSIKLVPVTGTVTKGGDPVEGISVTFTPEGGGVSSAGRTDKDGKFVLLSASGKAGAVPGTHKVTLQEASAEAGSNGEVSIAQMEEMAKSRGQGRQGAPVEEKTNEALIPADYADPAKTPLSYTIDGSSHDFDIPIP